MLNRLLEDSTAPADRARKMLSAHLGRNHPVVVAVRERRRLETDIGLFWL